MDVGKCVAGGSYQLPVPGPDLRYTYGVSNKNNPQGDGRFRPTKRCKTAIKEVDLSLWTGFLPVLCESSHQRLLGS